MRLCQESLTRLKTAFANIENVIADNVNVIVAAKLSEQDIDKAKIESCLARYTKLFDVMDKGPYRGGQEIIPGTNSVTHAVEADSLNEPADLLPESEKLFLISKNDIQAVENGRKRLYIFSIER
jgi:hypothetical protein